LTRFISKLFNSDWTPEDDSPEITLIEEEDFWQPGGWVDNRSHWEQYDEMPWNG
jgi:hypothetical protein